MFAVLTKWFCSAIVFSDIWALLQEWADIHKDFLCEEPFNKSKRQGWCGVIKNDILFHMEMEVAVRVDTDLLSWRK